MSDPPASRGAAPRPNQPRAAPTRTVEIEIEIGSTPIRGLLRGSQGPEVRPFCGWIELAAEIEAEHVDRRAP